MFKGSDKRLWVERLLPASASGSSCRRYSGLRKVFDKILDQKVFALRESARENQKSWVAAYGELL